LFLFGFQSAVVWFANIHHWTENVWYELPHAVTRAIPIPYLLHNHSIWKSIEDNQEEKIGKDLRGCKKRIVSEDDWGWFLNPVIPHSIKNRSMDPHFGGGRVHP
jgi:hypothetical protein